MGERSDGYKNLRNSGITGLARMTPPSAGDRLAPLTVMETEQIKFLANALDRASTAIFSLGILTPMASYYFDINNMQVRLGPWGLIAYVVVSLMACAALHLGGRRVLGAIDK